MKRKHYYLLKQNPSGSGVHYLWTVDSHGITRHREVANIFGGIEECFCVCCTLNRRYARYVKRQDNGEFVDTATGAPLVPFRDWISDYMTDGGRGLTLEKQEPDGHYSETFYFMPRRIING